MKTLEDLGRHWKSQESTKTLDGRVLRISTSTEVGAGKKRIEVSLIRYSNAIGVYVNQAHIVDLDEESAVALARGLVKLVEKVSS